MHIIQFICSQFQSKEIQNQFFKFIQISKIFLGFFQNFQIFFKNFLKVSQIFSKVLAKI
jgi:hypothetical protein